MTDSSSPLKSILVVDDAPATREIIGRNLTNASFRVFTASNVEEALKVLKAHTVDLVVTDLKMPGASGLEPIGNRSDHDYRIPLH